MREVDRLHVGFLTAVGVSLALTGEFLFSQENGVWIHIYSLL